MRVRAKNESVMRSKKTRRKQAMQKQKGKENAWKKALKAKIRLAKGKRFTGMFLCDLCKVSHTHGYVYNIEGEEYEICKFCYDSIFKIPHYIKILYTPMGNNQ